ncbi:MAG: helix-turn-helix transcriptional regulator [Phycisphaerales bacterium]|nr:helix-turn-helix transcriptional regulator [Phycisphaerales bacterium]
MILTPASHDFSGNAELLDDLRAGPYRVTHKRYTHDFAQQYHEHEQGSIDFVLEGGGRGVYSGREIVSMPGMVEFFREGIRHKYLGGHGRGIRTMHVLIPAETLRCMPELRDISIETLTHTRAHAIALAILSELHLPDCSSPLEIESLVQELVDEVTRAACQPSVRAGWIGTVRDLLHAVHDRPVSLDELSEHAGVHRAHLSRVFKGKLGMSVGAYHRAMRVQRAAQRLAGSDVSIARIANELGFADQAHLTRIFRDQLGVTPACYRQRLARR